MKEVKDDSYQLHLENKQLKNEITFLKAQINNMYKFVHKNLEPVVDTFCTLTATPERKAALDKNTWSKGEQRKKDRRST